MKNLIAFSILLFCVFNSSAQKKEQVNEKKAAEAVIKKPTTDTLKVDKSFKIIVIDSVSIPYENLRQYVSEVKTGKVPLFISPDWIVLNYQFLKKASSPGFNDEQMDFLKEPLIPWVQYLQRIQQQRQKQ